MKHPQAIITEISFMAHAINLVRRGITEDGRKTVRFILAVHRSSSKQTVINYYNCTITTERDNTRSMTVNGEAANYEKLEQIHNYLTDAYLIRQRTERNDADNGKTRRVHHSMQ